MTSLVGPLKSLPDTGTSEGHTAWPIRTCYGALTPYIKRNANAALSVELRSVELQVTIFSRYLNSFCSNFTIFFSYCGATHFCFRSQTFSSGLENQEDANAEFYPDQQVNSPAN